MQEGKRRLPNEGLSGLTQKEQELFWGRNYSYEYVSRMMMNQDYQVIYKNGLPRLLDKTNEICTVWNGHRIIPNTPKGAT